MLSTGKSTIIITSIIFGVFLWGCTNDVESGNSIDQVTSEEENEEVIEENQDPQSFIWKLQGQTIEDPSILFFGGSMDFNNTGNKIILGSADPPSACSNFCDGLVRVYDFGNGTWTQINSDLYGDNNNETDWIGHDVAINSDGNFIVVSYKPFANTIGYYTTRVFQNVNDDWVQVGQDIINSAGIGNAVALNAAGNVLVVAMPKNNSDYLTRVYKLNSNEWEQIGEDIKPGTYATKVALNYNGDVLAIGNSSGSGIVSFYDISENGWILTQQIQGSSEDDRLSSGLDFSSDGSTIILEGAFPSSCNNCIVKPFFKVYESDGDMWKQKGQEITWLAKEGYVINRQKAVAINQNGSRIAVGLQRVKEGSPTERESFVLVFQYSEIDDEWQQMPSIHEDGKIGGLWSLDMNDEGDIIAVGIDLSGRKSVEVFRLEPLE